MSPNPYTEKMGPFTGFVVGMIKSRNQDDPCKLHIDPLAIPKGH